MGVGSSVSSTVLRTLWRYPDVEYPASAPEDVIIIPSLILVQDSPSVHVSVVVFLELRGKVRVFSKVHQVWSIRWYRYRSL